MELVICVLQRWTREQHLSPAKTRHRSVGRPRGWRVACRRLRRAVLSLVWRDIMLCCPRQLVMYIHCVAVAAVFTIIHFCRRHRRRCYRWHRKRPKNYILRVCQICVLLYEPGNEFNSFGFQISTFLRSSMKQNGVFSCGQILTINLR